MRRIGQTGLEALLAPRQEVPLFEQYRACIDFPEHEVLDKLYEISGGVVDILGPMFWAVLFVLFIKAEFSLS